MIVDDHAMFAETLELALNMAGHDVVLVAPETLGSQRALLSRVLRHRPTITLLDLDLGARGDGASLITPLVGSGVHVVVVTSVTDRTRWGQCLSLGARTVLPKSGPLNAILATIRRIDSGLPVIDADERQSLIDLAHEQDTAHARTRERLALLTPREAEVLGRLIRGDTVRAVALAFVVTESTVRTQVKSILAKLEVSSQVTAVGLANQVGWRPPDRTNSRAGAPHSDPAPFDPLI